MIADNDLDEQEDFAYLDAASLKDLVADTLSRSASKKVKPRSSQIRRIGCLLIISALDSIGATPIERRHLQALLYLVDVLLPVFGDPSFEGLAYKRNSRPHQIDWLWDADRLIGMGLLSLADDESKHDQEYKVELSDLGRSAASNLMRDRPSIEKMHRHLQEISIAFSKIDYKYKLDIGKYDANCSDPHVANKETFEYFDNRSNHAQEVVSEITRKMPSGEYTKMRLATYAYIKLLEDIEVSKVGSHV